MRRYSVILLFIAFSFIGITATAAVPLDRVVAIVNTHVITQSQLDQAMDAYKGEMRAQGMTIDNPSEAQKKVLDDLIDKDLQLQLAKKAKLTITDQDVDAAIKKVADRNHLTLEQFYQAVQGQGMTKKQIRDQIHDQVLLAKLQQAAVAPNVHITDQEVQAYLKNPPKTVSNDTQFHLADILIPLSEEATPAQKEAAQQKAEDIAKQLRQGGDFEKLARSNSGGVEAVQGGDLGWRKLTDIPDVFAQKIANLKAGAVTAPIQAPNGFHILKLIAIKDNAKPLTEAEARNAVFQRKFQDQLHVWLNQLKKSTYIKVMV
jgi:peptidyl-prolyl cis-trans isomerase SurA